MIRRTAWEVGYSHRRDHSWNESAIATAADYKGNSTIAVTFNEKEYADTFIERINLLFKWKFIYCTGSDLNIRLVTPHRTGDSGSYYAYIVIFYGEDILANFDERHTLDGAKDPALFRNVK